jgi:hypothetical protein
MHTHFLLTRSPAHRMGDECGGSGCLLRRGFPVFPLSPSLLLPPPPHRWERLGVELEGLPLACVVTERPPPSSLFFSPSLRVCFSHATREWVEWGTDSHGRQLR